MFDIELKQKGQSIRFGIHKSKEYKEAKKAAKKQSAQASKSPVAPKSDETKPGATAPPEVEKKESVPVPDNSKQPVDESPEISIGTKNLKIKGKVRIHWRQIWLRVRSSLKKYKFSLSVKTSLFEASIVT